MPRLCRGFEATTGTSSGEFWGSLFTWFPKDPIGVKDANSFMAKKQANFGVAGLSPEKPQ